MSNRLRESRTTILTVLIILGLAAALFLISALIRSPATAFSTGITGQSGQQGSTCAACHTGSQNAADPVTVTVSAPGAVNPGETVQLFVQISGGRSLSDDRVGGFNLSVQGAAGTLTSLDDASQIVNGEATHTEGGMDGHPFLGDSVAFVVGWTAPQQPGTYTVFASGISANADGGNGTGDIADSATTSIQVLEGLPAVVCFGQEVTVDLGAGDVPTDGDDVIQGTPGDDAIAAGNGDDLICGGGGNDSIWGQNGDDRIDGGDGDDRLRGGAGADEVLGGAGADDVTGGTGNDTVSGGDGDDPVVRGNTGDDMVFGGAGNDPLVNGNGGADEVSGDGGNDKVIGGPRPDTVSGGDGNDEVIGLNGADTLNGGAGNDEIRGGKSPDTMDGGPGTDTCIGGTTGGGALENDTAINCEEELSIP